MQRSQLRRFRSAGSCVRRAGKCLREGSGKPRRRMLLRVCVGSVFVGSLRREERHSDSCEQLQRWQLRSGEIDGKRESRRGEGVRVGFSAFLLRSCGFSHLCPWSTLARFYCFSTLTEALGYARSGGRERIVGGSTLLHPIKHLKIWAHWGTIIVLPFGGVNARHSSLLFPQTNGYAFLSCAGQYTGYRVVCVLAVLCVIFSVACGMRLRGKQYSYSVRNCL